MVDKNAFVTAPVGAAKTAPILFACKKRLKTGASTRILIFGPAKVARGVWAQEAAQWYGFKGLPIGVVAGESPTDRDRILRDPTYKIVTATYETMASIYDEWGTDLPFDGIVLDESDKMKSASTKRFRRHRHRLGLFNWRVALTATPTPNNLLELWAQAFCVDAGEALGTSFDRFKRKFFYPTDYMGYNWDPKPEAMDHILFLLRKMTLALTAEDCQLELPALHYEDIEIDLPPNARAVYDDMEAKARAVLAQYDGGEVDAASAAVQAQKLLQIAAGFVYRDDDNGVRHVEHLHDAKHDALERLLDRLGDEQVLLFYRFVAQRQAVLDRFPSITTLPPTTRGAGRTLEMWNEGGIRRLMVHPASAGHGLNLHLAGARYMGFLSPIDSGGQRTQAVGRLYRRGQTREVTVFDFSAKNTVDGARLRALAMKQKGESALLAALRERT